jgi:ribonuclease P protein component
MQDPQHTIRVGLTVSRKVGNAVVRNRARRRLRAVANEVLPRLAAPGLDYVLIGRAQTPHRAYATLIADLGRALGALRVSREARESAPNDQHKSPR